MAGENFDETSKPKMVSLDVIVDVEVIFWRASKKRSGACDALLEIDKRGTLPRGVRTSTPGAALRAGAAWSTKRAPEHPRGNYKRPP